MKRSHIESVAEKDRAWRTYKRLIGYTRPYLLRLVYGLIFGVLYAAANTGLLDAIRRIIKEVFDPQTASLQVTCMVAGLLVIVTFVRGLIYFLSTYFIEWVGNRVVMDIRTKTFEHLQQLSLYYFSQSRTGELISRISNDTLLLQRAVSSVIGQLIRQPFVLIGIIGYLLWLAPWLALVSFIIFPVCIIPVALFGRRVRRFTKEQQEKLADLVSILQETITGVRIVKAFCTERYELNRFIKQCRSVLGRAMRVAKARAAVEPIVVFISTIGFCLVLLYTRWMQMPVEEFMVFGGALVVMYDPVKKLSRIHVNIQQSSAAADRVFEILDTDSTIQEKDDARDFSGAVEMISFKRVGFAYADTPVLSNITLSVSAGACIAIVGSSGSGKTTLLSLIPRFFDVTEGAILLNGTDIRDFALASLRRRIGIVTQETFLFNDTIARNIAYGDEKASRTSIEEVAKRAHADAFIREMPKGYESVIGERGVKLSGGQAQRIAIARAMLRNPPIMILDEATSALDTESERQVQAALDELMADRTVFAIAHRLSTIAHADRIVVLDQGRIVEEGTHEELLVREGAYKRLYDLQFAV